MGCEPRIRKNRHLRKIVPTSFFTYYGACKIDVNTNYPFLLTNLYSQFYTKMKKLLLTLTLLLAVAAGAFAAKETVQINQFTGASNVSADELSMVRDAVVMAFSDKGRFIIVDAATGADGATAKYAVDGKVNPIVYTYTTSKNSDGTVTKTYEAPVSVTLTVIDLATGATKSNTIVDSNKGFLGGINPLDIFKEETAYTQAIALKNATMYMAKTGKKLPEWIEKNFPATGSIIELDEVKKDEVKTAFISLGSADGMVKGQKFTVKLITTVAGRTRQKEIGEAQCEAVEGEDISLVKIKKGGKEIFAAYSETPDNLIIETKK